MIRPHCGRLLWASLALLVSAAGAPDADEGAIRGEIAALDSESFAERQRAAGALIEWGEAAMPFLLEAKKSESAERRTRAAELLATIGRRRLERDFAALGGGEIEVERGMVLIAQILDPEVTAESVGAQLDAIAEAVRRGVGEDVDPSELPPAKAAGAVVAVLRDEMGLKGDHVSYDHPDNSSVHRVLQQKDGLPILLSEIAVAVSGRLGIAVVGLPVPGQYMIRFGDGEDGGTIVDPHDGWRVRRADEIVRLRGFGFEEREMLTASTPRQTVVRMLNNLEADFFAVGDRQQAEAVKRYRYLFERAGGE